MSAPAVVLTGCGGSAVQRLFERDVVFEGGDVTVAEDGQSVDVVIRADIAATRTFDVTLEVEGSATPGADYVALPASLRFKAGAREVSFTVALVNDTLPEFPERIEITLRGGEELNLPSAPLVVTITDDDSSVDRAVSVADAVASESDLSLAFVVSLDGPSPAQVSVAYATSDRTATSGADYVASTGTVTFAPGETTKTISVPVVDDSIGELDEELQLDLSQPVNVELGDASAVGTVSGDGGAGGEDEPDVSVADASASEAEGVVTLTVSLSQPSAFTVLVDYATADGVATAPADYAARSGTLSFAPGVTSMQVQVPVVDDDLAELAEDFALRLTGASHAVLLDDEGTATILADSGAGGGDQPSISVADSSAAEAAGMLAFVVTLSNPSTLPITMAFATADDTATAGLDYTASSGTVAFAPGETELSLLVVVTDDTIAEPAEALVVTLTDPTNATLGDAIASGVIAADGGSSGGGDTPSLSVTSHSVLEDDGSVTLTVTLSSPSAFVVDVSFATANESALAGFDYTAASGALSFAAGETTKTVRVDLLDDSLSEPDETFTLRLADAVNATLPTTDGTVTIAGDASTPGGGDLPALRVADASAQEDGGSIVFSITLTNASALDISADFVTSGGSASSDVDFTARSGRIDIAAGDTTAQVTVQLIDDDIGEGPEAFSLVLQDPVRASLGDAIGVGTILGDEDHPTDGDEPTLSISGPSLLEHNGPARFTVTLSNVSARDVTVVFSTSNGTATQPEDYTARTAETLTIPAGVTSMPVDVTVVNDDLAELDEAFTLTLSAPAHAALSATSQATATLFADDLPTITVLDASGSETGEVTFTLSLSNPSTQTVEVGYTTASGTALEGADFDDATGTVTFAALDVLETVTVNAHVDNLAELAETFQFSLSGAVAASIGTPLVTGTIAANETPSMSISSVTVDEDAGTATLEVTLSNPSTLTVGVTFATANGGAVAPGDYGSAGGSLSFAPGDTSESITVNISDELLAEGAETILVNLSAQSNATIADGQGVITINASDPTTVDVAGASIAESAGSAVFAITLTNPAQAEVRVSYATGGTADTAVAGDDYTAVGSVAIFTPGATRVDVPVSVANDDRGEAAETFTLALNSPANATIGTGSATATIGVSDTPTVSIANDAADEGDDLAFAVTLSNVSDLTVTVAFATANSTALATADYNAASGTLTFSPGDTSETVLVQTLSEALAEPDEELFVNLGAITNATALDGQAIGTINGTGPDGLPRVSVSDASTDESGNLVFTVTLSVPSAVPVSVEWFTQDGTAVAPGDYTAVSAGTPGVVSFAANDQSETFTVVVANDDLGEIAETLTVRLQNATAGAAVILDGDGSGTINLSDTPTASINDVAASEGAANPSFTVSLSNASTQTITVNFATGDASASAPGDYTATSGTLTFNPSVTTRDVAVAVVDDNLGEPAETFVVNLSLPGGATISDGQGQATIALSDTPSLAVNDVAGDESTGSLTFTLTLSNAASQDVTVSYATSDVSATEPTDYADVSGAVTFAPNETSKTVSVVLANDDVGEAAESFVIDLSGLSGNASMGDAQGVGTINVNDTPVVSIANASGNEGGAVTHQLTLSNASDLTVTVRASTSDDTALAGSDYTAVVNQLVTFNPGATTANVAVSATDDPTGEAAETFFVTLSNPTNATVGTGVATGTVNLNDTPTISIADVTVGEDAGTATLTVTLGNASNQTVTIAYATANGSAGATDYTSASGTLTFVANDTEEEIVIDILGDNLGEGLETVLVNLTSPSNAAFGDNQGVVSISASDTPEVTFSSTSVPETAGTLAYAVTLSNPSTFTVLVDYALTDGLALAPGDYTDASGQLVFTPSVVSQDIVVFIVNDDLAEVDEDFYVDLANPLNATLPVTRRSITVSANDTPDVFIDDVSVAEDGGPAIFTVELSNPSSLSVSVTVTTTDNTALSPTDYTSFTQVVTFLPGDTTETLPVIVVNNGTAEADETFLVNLSTPVNANISDNQGVGTITNDDANPTVTISASQSAAEAAGTATVQIFLSAASDLTVSVPYSVSGDAQNPGDYSFDVGSPTSPVSFAPGVTSRALTVNLETDGMTESAETVVITLGAPTNGSLGSPSAHTLTIVDNDTPVTLTAAETLDADHDGLIDHYKLTFSEAVDDDTFPGYALNGTGGTTSDWLVAGLTDVKLKHGTAAPATDTAYDNVLFVSFTETASMGTDAAPQVTTTATPRLQSEVGGTTVTQVTNATVVEADKAMPVLTRATTEASLNVLNVFFSEPIYVSSSCASIPASALVYNDDSGGDVSGVAVGSDSNGCDEKLVVAAVNGPFSGADMFVDTVEPNTATVRDAVGNVAYAQATVITGIIHPYVLSAVSTGPLTTRITFSEDMNAAQAVLSGNYSLTSTCQTPTLTGGTAIDGSTYEFNTVAAQCTGTYTFTVTGNVRDYDEDAAMVAPLFATFQGNEVLRVVSATPTSLRTVLLTFSKDVKESGVGGVSNTNYFTVSASLGGVTGAVRYDSITSSAADKNKVLVTHAEDQGGAFYLAVVSTLLRKDHLTEIENLAGEPLDRASFQGLGGRVTEIGHGALFTDPFSDGTTFSFVFEHQGKIYAGTNDNSNAVFRFDPDGSNPVPVTFRVSSSSGTFTSFGSSIMRPSVKVESGGGVTRYYLTVGTDLSLYGPGDDLLASGCTNTTNDHATSVTLSAVNDASDYVEIGSTGIASLIETCLVTLYTTDGPLGFSGVDSFVSAPLTSNDTLIFGVHNYGGGNANELFWSTDSDTVLDTNYCNVAAVTLGNWESLQSIYGYGNHVFFAYASDSNSAQPILASINLGAGTCGTLSDKMVSSNKEAKTLNYLGGNGSPANSATNVGIDSMVVAADGSSVLGFYAANNGGLSGTPNVPPTGSSVWAHLRHDGDGVWTGTTQLLPGIGKLRPGEKSVPLMASWGGYLFVARNRSDSGGVAEVWRFSLAAGLTGSPAPSDASRWTRVVASTDTGMNINNRDVSMLIVNGNRLYVGFDNETNGAEVWRTKSGVTGASLDAFADLEQIGVTGLGPAAAGATALAKNKHILSSATANFDGSDYLYLTVGCLTDLRDGGACDRDTDPDETDFAIRMFRQVD